eukprot:TRINITY_DN1180_c0_g1_i1.p1 TRINITY_DN1180_c0_g1~~TRINITY_DN1180_c0_g1_i1.p1  ORF type:complete len:303 (-),score=43.45 TRINITY_DN1180_c0_g1_i1:850-1758(-)
MSKEAPRLARGMVDLVGAKIKALKSMYNHSNIIRIECVCDEEKTRTFYLSTYSSREQEDWVDAIVKEVKLFELLLQDTPENWVQIKPVEVKVNEINPRHLSKQGIGDPKSISSSLRQQFIDIHESLPIDPHSNISSPKPAEPLQTFEEEKKEDTVDMVELKDPPSERKTSIPNMMGETNRYVTDELMDTLRDTENPVVIDMGSGFFKAGISSAEASVPQTMFQSVIGRLKYNQYMDSQEDDEKVLFGKQAINSRGILSLTHPIVNGMIQDWDETSSLLEYALESELEIDISDHPVLITEYSF